MEDFMLRLKKPLKKLHSEVCIDHSKRNRNAFKQLLYLKTCNQYDIKQTVFALRNYSKQFQSKTDLTTFYTKPSIQIESFDFGPADNVITLKT